MDQPTWPDAASLAMAGGFDQDNPCPQCGAPPLAPGDGAGRTCIECGCSWEVGREGGRFVPDLVRVGRGWQRYARTLLGAMEEVLEEADQKHRELILETANYWLAMGLVLGLERREAGERLLGLIEPKVADRDELREDAGEFIADALP